MEQSLCQPHVPLTHLPYGWLGLPWGQLWVEAQQQMLQGTFPTLVLRSSCQHEAQVRCFLRGCQLWRAPVNSAAD